MPLARETRARAEARAFAVQVLVVLLVNELRLECPFKALERIVPVLDTILTNGLRALVLVVHPGSSIPHGIRLFLRPLGCFGVSKTPVLSFIFGFGASVQCVAVRAEVWTVTCGNP